MSEEDKNGLTEVKQSEKEVSDSDMHPGCAWALGIFLVLFGLLWLVGANAFEIFAFFIRLIWIFG